MGGGYDSHVGGQRSGAAMDEGGRMGERPMNRSELDSPPTASPPTPAAPP